MDQDLEKALAGFGLGILLVIFGFLSKFVRDKNDIQATTKKEKISRGLKQVIHVSYVTRGVCGVIIILISSYFLLKYLIK